MRYEIVLKIRCLSVKRENFALVLGLSGGSIRTLGVEIGQSHSLRRQCKCFGMTRAGDLVLSLGAQKLVSVFDFCDQKNRR